MYAYHTGGFIAASQDKMVRVYDMEVRVFLKFTYIKYSIMLYVYLYT